MSSNFLKSQSTVLVESALCGIIHEGINRFYSGYPINFSQGALSAGSHYISGSVSETILPMAITMAPALASVTQNLAQPVVSGAIYSLPILLGRGLLPRSRADHLGYSWSCVYQQHFDRKKPAFS